LSVRRRDALNAIASQSNRHPPKRFDFKCPLKVMGEVMQDVVIAMQHNAPLHPFNDRLHSAPAFALFISAEFFPRTIAI
jgi:hypothetical protein